MKHTIEAYDVERHDCPTDYACCCCEVEGDQGLGRLLLIDTEGGSIVLCYNGCAQELIRVVNELASPEPVTPNGCHGPDATEEYEDDVEDQSLAVAPESLDEKALRLGAEVLGMTPEQVRAASEQDD